MHFERIFEIGDMGFRVAFTALGKFHSFEIEILDFEKQIPVSRVVSVLFTDDLALKVKFRYLSGSGIRLNNDSGGAKAPN